MSPQPNQWYCPLTKIEGKKDRERECVRERERERESVCEREREEERKRECV